MKDEKFWFCVKSLQVTMKALEISRQQGTLNVGLWDYAQLGKTGRRNFSLFEKPK